jgi:hypothetical protein
MAETYGARRFRRLCTGCNYVKLGVKGNRKSFSSVACSRSGVGKACQGYPAADL